MSTSGSGGHTVVIGAGQAGFSFCARLRELGFEGAITLIGEESTPPYQRPPLSKAYLLREMTLERLLFRPEDFYSEQNIDLRLSVRAAQIAPADKTVTLSDGTALAYDTLVLATGSRPRLLPADISGGLDGIYYVRSVADADAVEREVKPGRRALVVGGGYIGLEAAAVAAKQGVEVTLIEATDRILQRVACEETSDYFRELHRAHGVDVREGTGLERLSGSGGRVESAKLGDGTELEVDFVIAGIGIIPNQELAADAGLQTGNGIEVDEMCRTSDPNILAVGDCASFAFNGSRIRLESVGHAIDHAHAAAAVVMGTEAPYQAKPWFWSDQYDTKLQIAGLSLGFDRIVTRESNERSTSFWYFQGDELLAVDAMNEPRAYMVAKRLIEAGKSPSPEAVADTSTDLKTLLKG